jgi:hypothetical protein
VCGRVVGSLLAFKVKNSIFFFFLLLLNLIILIIYSIPSFHKIENFYWYIILSIALASAPIVPSCFMIAKYVLSSISPLIVSTISIGMSIGYILSQYFSAYLIDKLKLDESWLGYENVTHSIYIIPYLLLFYISLAFPVYLLIMLINNRCKKLID